MADSWTIVSADSVTIEVEIVVNDVLGRLNIALDDIDTSNSNDILISLRDIASAYRQDIVDRSTPPIIVNALVGHTETF